jgi:hypothetical protein
MQRDVGKSRPGLPVECIVTLDLIERGSDRYGLNYTCAVSEVTRGGVICS